MAHVHVNWLSPTKIRTMVIGGSQRTVVWDDMNPSQRLSVYDRGVDRQAADELGPDDRKQIRISYRTGDMVAPALREQEALRVDDGGVRAPPSASAGRRPPTAAPACAS